MVDCKGAVMGSAAADGETGRTLQGVRDSIATPVFNSTGTVLGVREILGAAVETGNASAKLVAAKALRGVCVIVGVRILFVGLDCTNFTVLSFAIVGNARRPCDCSPFPPSD